MYNQIIPSQQYIKGDEIMLKKYNIPKEAELWVSNLKREGWSANTQLAYTQDICFLFNFTKKSPLNITKQDINDYLYTSETSSTFERRRASISKFFNWLIGEELRSDNPTLSLGIMKSKHKEDPKFLVPDELKKLKQIVDKSGNLRNIALMSVFMNLGLRESEVRRLDIKNISGDYISIKDSKGGYSRTIPLPESTKRDIQAYLNTRIDNNPAMFLSRDKKRLGRGGIVKIVKKQYELIDKGNEGLTAHSLRHSACTGFILAGMDIVYAGEMMGHKSITTTKNYTHILSHELKKRSIDLLK